MADVISSARIQHRMYLNDLVKLAGTSRMALEPAMENQVALIRYQVAQHKDWHEIGSSKDV